MPVISIIHCTYPIKTLLEFPLCDLPTSPQLPHVRIVDGTEQRVRPDGEVTHETTSDPIQVTVPTREEMQQDLEGVELRRRLKFFFMNPVEKWIARRQTPWKLGLQVIKIIIVTAQLIKFGQIRMSHINYMDSSNTVFRHLFLKGWDFSRDIMSYPPPNGPLAVYTKEDFYDSLTNAVQAYYFVNVSSIGGYDFNYNTTIDDDDTTVPPTRLCVTEFLEGSTFPFNESYIFDTHVVSKCYDIQPVNATPEAVNESFSMKKYCEENNITIDFDRLKSAVLSFVLKTISVKHLLPSDGPDCFSFNVSITYSNDGFDGQVKVDLNADVHNIRECHKMSMVFGDNTQLEATILYALDAAVMISCFLSFILCTRALYRANVLRKDTIAYFLQRSNKRLSSDDQLAFLNLWYVSIVVNDICSMVGTAVKISLELQVYDQAKFTAAGILLGFGTFLVWIGVLRYLGFFSKYNVLILTIKKAFPNVMRFLLCAGLIYAAFLLCGWIVLGPYHAKFRTLTMTSECLFSLINGDDMFATFSTMSERNTVVFWFAKIYLYLFVCVFIYVVLSLFISIIMDHYEIVKEKFELDSIRLSDLQEFISQCQDSPSSGKFRVVSTPWFSRGHWLRVQRLFTRRDPSSLSYGTIQ